MREARLRGDHEQLDLVATWHRVHHDWHVVVPQREAHLRGPGMCTSTKIIISTTSRRHLGGISAASRRHLAWNLRCLHSRENLRKNMNPGGPSAWSKHT